MPISSARRVRWLQRANRSAELGWVRSFQTNDNPEP